MAAKNETKDDDSAESPTSVLEDEVCFLFPLVAFSLFSYCLFCLVLGNIKETAGKESRRIKKLGNDFFERFRCL